ncbi:MAG: hypothetical protein FJZ38_23230 [Candidatus Rokubacteria bacterium]|nr:hypothetical protein [Candidatus Rokubacteria bacterium]
MPWSVLSGLDTARRRARESGDRVAGACQDTVATVLIQTSALLRRRGTEDMAAIAALIRAEPHCVPCIGIVTDLDARRVYAALERLKASVQIELVSGRCTRCGRTTTVHTIQGD